MLDCLESGPTRKFTEPLLYSKLPFLPTATRYPMEQKPRRLLDQVRDAIRLKHYSIRTEETYVNWINGCSMG